MVGVIFEPVELPWPLLFTRNLSLRTGLVNPQRHVARLLALIEAGRLDPTEVITHRRSLDDGPEAYELFAARKDGVLKVAFEA